MRALGILLTAAFVAYFTPIEAHNQLKPSSTDEKIYVKAENLYFGDEGIFWQAGQASWVPVSSVNCDSQGLYLTRANISLVCFVCTACGRSYRYKPSRCENRDCNSTSFEPVYEDMWDREP